MRESTTIETFNASGRERSARGLGQRSGAVLGAVVVLVMAFAGPAAANSTRIPAATGADIEVSWTVTGGDGLMKVNPIVYTVTVDDCTRDAQSATIVSLNSPTAATDRDRWIRLYVDCPEGKKPNNFQVTSSSLANDPLPADMTDTENPNPFVLASANVLFQLSAVGAGPAFASIIVSPTTDFFPPKDLQFQIFTPPVINSGGGGGSSNAASPDPRDATVAVVAEQVAAAGVEGSADGVRVRGTEVLPVTSRLSGAVGPRGGVVLSSEGLEVRVASLLGARSGTGVLVPSSGEIQASVTGGLVPGSVVEVWINSTPRLVAAAVVPEDGATVIVIPTGAPLDGGGPIEDGAHTLELRMSTTDGFEVVATGITVGSPVPSGVPAGEGGLPVGAGLIVLLGAAGAALVAGRRLVTAG